jgi:hypothetical protein
VEAVQAIGKPMYVHCPHQCNKGCDIYDSRPSECASFKCQWLYGRLREQQRPDKLGLMFTVNVELEGKPTLLICETRKGAAEEYGVDKLSYLIDKLNLGLPIAFIPYGCQMPLVWPVDPQFEYPFPADFGEDCYVQYQKVGRYQIPAWTESKGRRINLVVLA